MKDYPTYLASQIRRAENKWGRKHDFDEIFKQQLRLSWRSIKHHLNEPETICCMGCRQGTEVFEFKGFYPEAEVHGVDITRNIETIKSHLDIKISLNDFNDLPDEWEDKFDLVFSNSLDHSYKVADTIAEWRRVTKNGGHLFLELSTTRANDIEHSFRYASIKKLFADFEIVETWKSPERNIITVLAKVVK